MARHRLFCSIRTTLEVSSARQEEALSRMLVPNPSPPQTFFVPHANPILSRALAAVNNSTLAAYMKDWFISFVTDLDPNARSFSPESASKPFWPLYNPRLGTAGSVDDDYEFAIMDVNYTQVGVIPDFDVSDKCDFWFGRSFVVRN
jgi:hypothetical protein